MKQKVKRATTVEVVEWLKKNDLDVWLNKDRVGRIRQLATIEIGKIRSEDWTKGKEACKFFTKAPRRSRKSRKLSSMQWERLREAVLKAREYLTNRSIEQAAMIVSAWYPCNPYLLEGLSQDLHFWVKPSRPLTAKPFWLE